MNEDKNVKLEDALRRIEEILKILENEKIELEEALLLYEEAMNLIRLCEEKIKFAKMKIEVILKNGENLKSVKLEEASKFIKNGK
ncbi:MAG: exodeoxyribonuclease VII small subunit [Thermodesulfobacteriota bacterium]|nr:MAG: exodeoxyribonuclease VII small subunit [Thermodesulfobacteriota bacterium]